jgi:DNA-directed RNA polymerase subunit RPC12/RpoP
MIPFSCPACSKRYSAPDDKAGKKVRCPECGAKLVVPPKAMVGVLCDHCLCLFEGSPGRVVLCPACGNLCRGATEEPRRVPTWEEAVTAPEQTRPRPAPRTEQKGFPTIRFACGSCSRSYEVPEEAAGKKTKCPQCGQLLTVPVLAAEGAPAETEPSPSPWNPWLILSCSLGAAFLVLLVVATLPQKPDRPSPAPAYHSPAPSPPPAPVSKLTKENFLAVREGMGESEVTLILGQPTRRMAWPDLPPGSVRLTWEEGRKKVEVFLRRKDERSGSKVDGKFQEGLE